MKIFDIACLSALFGLLATTLQLLGRLPRLDRLQERLTGAVVDYGVLGWLGHVVDGIAFVSANAVLLVHLKHRLTPSVVLQQLLLDLMLDLLDQLGRRCQHGRRLVLLVVLVVDDVDALSARLIENV